MTLYSHGFALLPRPERSIFSLGNETTRATLPDFATVDELRTFVTRLLILQYTVPNYFAQLYFSIAVLCALILVVLSIIVGRIYERSFWLIRIIKRPSGTLVVPNALLAFTLVEGVYAMVYVAFGVSQNAWFKTNTQLPYGFLIWLSVTWCPLIFGPMLAVWGPSYAASEASSSTAADGEVVRTTRWWHLGESAMLINIVGAISPVLLGLSIVIPAVRANRHHQHALNLQQQWLGMYVGQTHFSQPMVQDAQTIWYTFLRGCRITSAVFVVWTVYAILLGVAYVWVSLRLILRVRREMQHSRDATHQPEMMVDDTATQKRCAKEVMRKVEAMMNALPSKGNGDATNVRQDEDKIDDVVSSRNAKDFGTNGRSRATNLLVSARGYIPNVVAAATSVCDEGEARAETPLTRRKQADKLQKAYYHILYQTALIAPGCFIFAGIACWAALETYASTEQPLPSGAGTYGQSAMPRILLLANWVTVVIGCMTLLAVAQRTYEPLLRGAAR